MEAMNQAVDVLRACARTANIEIHVLEIRTSRLSEDVRCNAVGLVTLIEVADQSIEPRELIVQPGGDIGR